MSDYQAVWRQLHGFCAAHEWRGIDPYDGLNSPLARLLPGKKARQAWTQLQRRSPVNLRPLCGIKPRLNSTAVALFAMGSGDAKLLELLRGMQNPDGGWGYPFPWQSRAFYAPANTSNLICTVWAAKALSGCGGVSVRRRDNVPSTAPASHRAAATPGKEFIENNLIRDGYITYIAGSDTQVHNINLLGAAWLGRRDCMEWSVKRQRPDGSWPYGEAANQQWIDNFHTGYNLVALCELGGFDEAAARGFAYWDKTFWTADFAPRYYHNQMYPLDIHCCAQGILTYLAFGEPDKARRVADWALKNMWDKRGFFWYQRGHWLTNRIPYLRWAQAWMYYALAELLKDE